MDSILCPNCKATADIHKIDGADYINCPECGWFMFQADKSMQPCDPPGPGPAAAEPQDTEPPEKDNLLLQPAIESGDGQVPPVPPPLQPSPDEPDNNEDDNDSINVRINFED